MRKLNLAILASAVLGPFAATGANAMPIAPPVAATSSVEQVGWVCNPLGRCWLQPNDYRRYGYYRRYAILARDGLKRRFASQRVPPKTWAAERWRPFFCERGLPSPGRAAPLPVLGRWGAL
jgi:hypothetical protein